MLGAARRGGGFVASKVVGADPIGLRSGTQCHLVLKHTLKLVWPKSYRSCVRYRTDELKSQA